MPHTLSKLLSMLCLIGLLASLLGCDTAPTPPMDLGTPTTLSATPTPTPPATSEPAAACTTPAVVGKLNLLPLPDNVLEPVALAMLNGRLYVAGQRSHNVGVIENEQLSRVIPVGSEPTALVADEASGKLFVLHSQGLLLSMLDGERVQATIPLSNSLKGEFQSALSMVGDPLNHRLYVALRTPLPDPEIVVVDTQAFTVSTRVPFNRNNSINQMALDTARNELLVADYDATHSTGYINTLDLQSLRWTDEIKMAGKGVSNFLLYDPQSSRAYTDYTEMWSDHHIGVIDSGRLVSSLTIDRQPQAAQVAGGRLYLTNSYSSTLMVNLQTFQTMGTIDVDAAPEVSALLVDAPHERLYIAVRARYWPEASRIEVVDLKRMAVAHVIPLSAQPRQLVADATRNRLYALMPAARAVVASDGQRVLAQVSLERAPFQMVLDEAAGKLYISEFSGNSVNVMDAAASKLVERKSINGSGVVAVDKARSRLLVSNRTYALDTLAPTGQYTVTPFTPPPGVIYLRPPEALLVNPSVPRIYAVGWNGVLGGNDGNIIYLLDGDTLQQLSRDFDWTVTNIALDDEAQRLYATLYVKHTETTRLKVFDALNLTPISAMYLPTRTWVKTMLLNSNTHHLFLAHARYVNTTEADNTLEVLDTRTLGRVALLALNRGPTVMAALGERVYIASSTDTNLTIVRDCALPAPPPPTATP